MTDTREILFIDAYNLFIRHYQANPAISLNGDHVGGVIGFLRSMQHAVDNFRPKLVYIAWEGGGSSRRKSIYPAYKDNRRPLHMNKFFTDDIPDSMENRNKQMKLLVSLLGDLPVCQLYVADCEADDVISYVCKYIHPQENKLIFSSDHDFYQLLDENTRVCSITKNNIVTHCDVLSKYNIRSRNFCLARSICGDSSDNIDGIRGAGLKVISKRFTRFADDSDYLVDDVIEDSRILSGSSKIKLFTSICEGEETIRRNWKLMFLDTGILTSDQINRMISTAGTFEVRANKISFKRTLLKEGLNTFDVDWFLQTLNYLLSIGRIA